MIPVERPWFAENTDHDPQGDESTLKAAVAACQAAGGIRLSDQDMIFAVWVNAYRFNSHIWYVQNSTKRAAVIAELAAVEETAGKLAGLLENLTPRTQKALAKAIGRLEVQDTLSSGLKATALSQQDISEVAEVEVPLSRRLRIHERCAKLAQGLIPEVKGGQGNTLFRKEHGSPKGQLVVHLLDLLFPVKRLDLHPNGDEAGHFHAAIVAVATYADPDRTRDEGFDRALKAAVKLHTARSRLLSAGVLPPEQANHLRRIADQLSTL